MAEELRTKLTDHFLICPICTESFMEPKTLPCMHSFCKLCLEKYCGSLRKSTANIRSFDCPTCRKETEIPNGGVHSFQNSFFIDSLKGVLGSSASRDGDATIRRDVENRGEMQVGLERHLINIQRIISIKTDKVNQYLKMKQQLDEYQIDVIKRIEERKGQVISKVKEHCEKLKNEVNNETAEKCDEILTCVDDLNNTIARLESLCDVGRSLNEEGSGHEINDICKRLETESRCAEKETGDASENYTIQVKEFTESHYNLYKIKDFIGWLRMPQKPTQTLHQFRYGYQSRPDHVLPTPSRMTVPKVMTSNHHAPITSSDNESSSQSAHVQVLPPEPLALTPSMLASAPPKEQKQMLGERLYPLIQTMYPDLAGKVTGMLLDLDNSELLRMLVDRERLRKKVDEAIAVLQRYQSRDKHQAQNAGKSRRGKRR